MSRGLSSALKTKLASGSFGMAHLVKLELNTTYYYTDSSSNFTLDTNEYTSNGFLKSIGSFKESSAMNIGSKTIVISAVDQTIVSDLLGNDYLHRPVTITRFILDDVHAVVGSFQIYSGFVDGMSISEDNSVSTIALSVANHWSDFERKTGRRTNTGSQAQFFPGDKAFEFADQVGKKLRWGEWEQPLVEVDPDIGRDGDHGTRPGGGGSDPVPDAFEDEGNDQMGGDWGINETL